MAIQARTEFAAAINQIASEKGVDVQVILDAIKQAALAAYRKDLSFRNEAIPDDVEELEVKIDPATGEISIWRKDANITPPGFARIAAQTAKQVITQKLHEAEKGAIFEEYEQKVGSVISGVLQRQDGNTWYVDLGRAEGVMPPSEQIRDEYYGQNQRMKFLIKEIREGGRGPEVVVSRSDPALVKGLFALEVPEIQSGSVEIKGIAREAGGRTKVAVISSQDGVDPVGSMVGQKGVRVQAVINELGEEKIDIIQYSDDPARYIAAALSPAKEVTVELDEETKIAKVKVSSNQLSLAIGKGGQNVRLAAKLTGWKIDIEGTGEGENQEKGVEEGSAKETTGNDTSDDQNTTANPVVDQIEEEIDKATEGESVDGATEPEPTEEESSAAVADAEADIESEDSKNKSSNEELGSMEEAEDTQRGDLIGDREPSDQEEAPIETAPAADFNEIEKERQEKEAENNGGDNEKSE